MAATRVSDHVAQALGRLAEQYKNKPLIAGMVAALVQQFQDLDDAAWQLATECYLYNDAELGGATVYYEAEGLQLDVLGVILGMRRQALTDDEYRLVLRAQVKLNRSSGTTEELLTIFHALLPTDVVVAKTWPPAYVTLTIPSVVTAAEAALYQRFLRQARAAAVAGTMLWQETADPGCFILSDAADCPAGAPYLEIDTNTGLGDATDPTAGGDLTGAGG